MQSNTSRFIKKVMIMKLKHSQLANLPDGKHPDGAGLYFRVWYSGTACLHDEPLATATHFGPFSGSLVIF